jgi:hypothetical protein
MVKRQLSEDEKGDLIASCFILGVLIFIFGMFYRASSLPNFTPKGMKYLDDHKCQRIGFSGEESIPTYRCDSGVWLKYEIEQLASGKIVR